MEMKILPLQKGEDYNEQRDQKLFWKQILLL
jgi:hypothetical protein